MEKDKIEKILSKDQRALCVKEVIGFFATQRDEVIGVVAAGEILDGMLDIIAPPIQHNSSSAFKKLLKERLEDLDVELDLLVD